MKHNTQVNRDHSVLKQLSSIPRKIIMMDNHDALTGAVLHQLCHEGCFDLPKAAYFVDNPDFDMIRGVAGISRDQVYVADVEHPWRSPDTFFKTLDESVFHKQVKSFCSLSGRRNNHFDSEVLQQITTQLHFDHPEYLTWPMKHDNHGILVFECSDHVANDKEHMLNGLSLLGLCPIA
jgi:hypothetical protein